MKNQLTFQNTTLVVIPHNNQTYITSTDLACALGYADTRSITKIYNRNQDESSADMTLVVNLTTKGFGNGNSEKDVRIFSLRGAHLIAMFSRTKVAKEFRKWVLDILDRETLQISQQTHPLAEPEPTYTFELTKYELKSLAWLWFALYKCLELLNLIHKPLEALGSRFGVTAYTHATEYCHTLNAAHSTIKRLTDGLENEWGNAIPTIRQHKVTGLARLAR